jgi:hypothetical protein
LPRKLLADDDELHEQNTVCANISLPEEKKKFISIKKERVLQPNIKMFKGSSSSLLRVNEIDQVLLLSTFQYSRFFLVEKKSIKNRREIANEFLESREFTYRCKARDIEHENL